MPVYTESLELLQLRAAERVGELGSFSWVPRTNRVTWSPGLYRVLGLPESTTASFDTFMSMVDADARDDALAESHAGFTERRPYNVEYWMTRADGKRIYVRGTGETCVLGGLDVVVGIVIDITNHYATAQRLNELRNKLRELGEL